jgi:hypothetical protein
MTVGERVRLVYMAATRMLSVILHGVSIELVALPAHHDIAATRFGVTGASAGAQIDELVDSSGVLWK